jgi:phosphoribosyl-AMP cyclohydrolase
VCSYDATLPFAVALKWSDDGLIPAIVQDAENGEVLMMAWMDEPALRETLTTGQTHFYSRSRRTHWHKGATSGHLQHVESIWLDCDGDVLLIKARQIGGACHEGYRSCFFRRIDSGGQLQIMTEPVFDPHAIYGSAGGDPQVLEKSNRMPGSVEEQSDKLILASKNIQR